MEIVDEDKIRNSEIDFGIATFSLSEKSENYYFIKDMPYGKLTEIPYGECVLSGI